MPAAGGPTRAGTGTPSAGRLPAVRPPWRYERSAEETAPRAVKPLQKHDRTLSVAPAYRHCRCPPGISSRKASLGISTRLATTLGHTPAQIHAAALNPHPQLSCRLLLQFFVLFALHPERKLLLQLCEGGTGAAMIVQSVVIASTLWQYVAFVSTLLHSLRSFS